MTLANTLAPRPGRYTFQFNIRGNSRLGLEPREWVFAGQTETDALEWIEALIQMVRPPYRRACSLAPHDLQRRCRGGDQTAEQSPVRVGAGDHEHLHAKGGVPTEPIDGQHSQGPLRSPRS